MGKLDQHQQALIHHHIQKRKCFFPISCNPPRGITLKAGVLLLDLDESLVDLFTVEFVIDCIILKFMKACL